MKKVVNLFDLLLTRLDLVCWFQMVLSFFVGLVNTAKKIKNRIFAHLVWNTCGCRD